MIKCRYVLLCNGVALLAVLLFLSVGWQTQTAFAASQTSNKELTSQVASNQLNTTQSNNSFSRNTAVSAKLQQQESSLLACSVDSDGDDVTNFTSADASAVQQAVDQAAPGDLLRVSGTCIGVQSRNGMTQTVYISQSVTIQGGYDPIAWTTPPNPELYPTLLDAAGNGRVAYIAPDTTVVLDGLILSHGDGDGGNGGAIFAATDVVWSLLNSTVSESSSSGRGGGIYNTSTQFTMANSIVMSNTAGVFGGGLQSSGATLSNINDSSVHHNSANDDGGGIHLDNNGTINIYSSEIHDNMATNNVGGIGSNGGGIANDSNTGVILLVDSLVYNNTAGDSGAGIFNNGILTLDETVVSENEAANDGGGLLNHGSGMATIMNSTIDSNRAFPTAAQTSRGAGIYNRIGGTVTVMTSTIQYNDANDNGGGIWNESTFNIVATTLLSNTTGNNGNGGGIWNNGNLTIDSSHVLSNTSPNNAGGLFNSNLGVISISDSTFAFNGANDGGGIYNSGVVATTILNIDSSTFHDNYVTGVGFNRGGAIYNNIGQLNLINSTLSHNMSSDQGAALTNGSVAEVTHVSILSNTSAANSGTGIYSIGAGAVMTLTNTAVAYNSGPGADTDCAITSGSIVDNGYNLIEDGTCLSAATSFSGDPLLGPLADNGGETLTHLPLPFSPVIDAIPVGSCAAATDQIGTARPVDGACDIGSVELAINYAPTAVADSYNTNENVTLNVPAAGVLANDIDADFGPLTAVLDTDVTSGTLTLNSDGSFTYVPDANFCGTDSFSYHANDGHVDSNTVTVTLNVACVNDSPVAVADSYNATEDTLLTVPAPGVLANDTDAENDPLTAVLDTSTMSGTLNLNSDGSFTYMPDVDFCGTDSFTYFANDGATNSVTSATVTINVACVNDDPVAAADSYNTDEDTALNVPAPGVLGNDTDADGDTLEAVLVDDVTNGTLSLAVDGSFTYTPDANFCGNDGFTYYATDNTANSATVNVTITVDCIADLPVAVNDVYMTDEDVTLTVPAPGVLSNDSDGDGDPLTAVLDSTVMTGTLAFMADGSFVYTPTIGWSGITTFTYHVEANGDSSNIATVTLLVGVVNETPVAVDDAYATTEDTALVVAAPGVLTNDTDGDGDPLTAVLDSTVMTGTLDFTATGAFTYTPPVDWSGVTTFTYHANDGLVDSNTAVVSITVTAVNDAPVAVADTYTTTEDTQLIVNAPGILANDSDAEGDPLTAVLESSVMTGTLVFTDDGSFTYTPPVGFSGVVTFTYHAEAGGDSSNTAVVTITVGAVNNAPTANDDSYSIAEDTTLTVPAPGVLDNDSDMDGDTLTAVLDSDVTNGDLTLSADGSFTYTPDADFCGSDSFTYHANDGEADSNIATVTIDVTCSNDAPIANDDMFGVTEDTTDNPLAVLSNDSDADGDDLSIVSVTDPDNGTAVISGTVVLYTPNPDFFGTDVFSYTISDGALTDTAMVTVTVGGINKPPTAVDDSYSVDENSSDNLLNVLVNDSDADGNSLTITDISNPAHGTVVPSGSGILYTPDPDFVGVDTFTYTISDGIATDTATVTITVLPVNTGFIIYLPFVVRAP